MAEEREIDKNWETKQKIFLYLQQGLSFKDACIASGSSERSGHRWKSEDGSFGRQVEASVVIYKQKLIKCVIVLDEEISQIDRKVIFITVSTSFVV